MKRIIVLLIVLILLIYLSITIKWSKLFSHGELSEAHWGLEESGECSACHTKGKRLDYNKCLGCHEEIGKKIASNSSYHARVGRECARCHSEHHGRSYRPVHLDIQTFDHSLTGWPLNEKHALFRCNACHSEDSYLLDKTRCIDCHRDPHQGVFGGNCKQCHNEQKFKIIKYKHKKTETAPDGKHPQLPCDDCHIIDYKDYPIEDKMIITFIGTDFSCARCHKDIHKGEYGRDCTECHNQLSFKE